MKKLFIQPLTWLLTIVVLAGMLFIDTIITQATRMSDLSVFGTIVMYGFLAAMAYAVIVYFLAPIITRIIKALKKN